MAKEEPIQMIEKMDNNRKKYLGVILSLIMVFVIGVVSAIDLFTTALAFKIAYIAALLIIIVGLVCYLRLKCKK